MSITFKQTLQLKKNNAIFRKALNTPRPLNGTGTSCNSKLNTSQLNLVRCLMT